jgi:hypothetical protein
MKTTCLIGTFGGSAAGGGGAVGLVAGGRFGGMLNVLSE